MDIKITPRLLSGRVTAPPSKSVAHRLLICAALAKGESVIKRISSSKDMQATIGCLRALGAQIELKGDTAFIKGIEEPARECVLDCCESGSTLRFLIPLACALGARAEFVGQGRLPQRPITPLLETLPKNGAVFEYENTMPFTVSGQLTPGRYEIRGDVSSQFITGLLLCLPLLEGDSEIVLTTALESRPYIDITIGAMKQFGVEVDRQEDTFIIKGGQEYRPRELTVEGDHSQAAFFEAAAALGADVEVLGVNVNSYQGDKKIVEIIKEIVYNNKKGLSPFDEDVSDIPDLVPILCVLGSFCEGVSYIRNAARLRIKECDRLHAMAVSLNSCGGRVTEYEDGLRIEGVGTLCGGEVPDFNDHRIPMAMSIAAMRSSAPIIIKGAQAVAKSYPDYWEVYKSLGGMIEEI